jgi:hypothetical protein
MSMDAKRGTARNGAKRLAGVAGGNGSTAHDLLLVIYGRAPDGLRHEKYSPTSAMITRPAGVNPAKMRVRTFPVASRATYDFGMRHR